MPRKPCFTDSQARELRALREQGWTGAALAKRFGVSETTISVYLRDGAAVRQEPTSSARTAIDRFVGELGPLDAEHRALAALAGVLADRIDSSRGAGTAAMAARTLADLVGQLASDVRRGESEEQARRALQSIGLVA